MQKYSKIKNNAQLHIEKETCKDSVKNTPTRTMKIESF